MDVYVSVLIDLKVRWLGKLSSVGEWFRYRQWVNRMICLILKKKKSKHRISKHSILSVFIQWKYTKPVEVTAHRLWIMKNKQVSGSISVMLPYRVTRTTIWHQYLGRRVDLPAVQIWGVESDRQWSLTRIGRKVKLYKLVSSVRMSTQRIETQS